MKISLNRIRWVVAASILISAAAGAAQDNEYFNERAALDLLTSKLAPVDGSAEYLGINSEGGTCRLRYKANEDGLSAALSMGPLQVVKIAIARGRTFYGHRQGENYTFTHFVNDNPDRYPNGQFGDGYRIKIEPFQNDKENGTWISLRQTRSDDLSWEVIFDTSCYIQATFRD